MPSEYPRPQFRRAGWRLLDGPWRFCFDDDGRYDTPSHVEHAQAWSHTIQVPFAPETARSGIGDTGYHAACWYEREFKLPPVPEGAPEAHTNGGPGGSRVHLHFGAVDYHAHVWVNGRLVGDAQGGHTPFTADVTDALTPDGPQRVTVRAEDDPHDLAKPRGKQDWQLEPHAIWYPRTTGIWQTVWLERVPATYVERIRWTPHVERYEIGFDADLVGGDRAAASAFDVQPDASASAAGRRHLRASIDGESPPPDRALRPRHRRLPQRAALEPRAADADRRRGRALDGDERVSTRSTSLHRAAERRHPWRPVPAERPALLAAHGARPGLLARHAG